LRSAPRRDTLKYNDDGGLIIYLGNQSPGKEKESNWLPRRLEIFRFGFVPIGLTRPSLTPSGTPKP